MRQFLHRLFGRHRVEVGATYRLISDDSNPFKRRATEAFVLDRRDGWVSYRYIYPDKTITVTSDSLPEDTFLSIYRRIQ